jgi:hypothetical protein
MRQEIAYGIILLMLAVGILLLWRRSRPRRSERHVRIDLLKRK